MSEKFLTLKALSKYIKLKFIKDINLQDVNIKCEISQINKKNGNYYLKLKDDDVIFSAIVFSRYVCEDIKLAKSGDEVIINGDIDIYEPRSNYQILIYNLIQYGKSTYYKEFIQLKNKLNKEGLFDICYKKKIPLFPEKIAIITGRNSAAKSDILINIKNRFPCVKIEFLTSLMQGNSALLELIQNLKKADELNSDIIILARGGGSAEDISVFNDEELARTIFNLKTPIITGIGHEIDTTIADLVADKRVSTPTASVIEALPDKNNLFQQLIFLRHKINNILKNKIIIENKKINNYENSIINAIDLKIKNAKNMLEYSKRIIQTTSYEKTLSRGFFIVKKKNKIATDKNIMIGDTLELVSEGKTFVCKVKDIV